MRFRKKKVNQAPVLNVATILDPKNPIEKIRFDSLLTPADRIYRFTIKGAGFVTFAVLFLIGLFLFIRAYPAFAYMGWHFFTTTQFNTNNTGGSHAKFGVLAALYGSVVVAIIAVIFAVPFSLAAALFINEYAPKTLLSKIPFRSFLIAVVDLMASVPSVIYGLWGFFVLQAQFKTTDRWIATHLAIIPVLSVAKGTTVYTGSYFIAGMLVAIMIIPIVTSISRELFSLTPAHEREGALALGATRARVIRDVVIRHAKGGIVGATMLGLGRALGEAVAVSIILSLVCSASVHVLQTGGVTIASLIFNRFGSGGTYGLSALMACGCVLFVFTLVINIFASTIVNRSRAHA